MPEKISTTNNKTYKYIKSLQQKKNRYIESSFTVEGIKSVSDAINSKMSVRLIAVSEYFYNNVDFFYPKDLKIVIIKTNLYSGLCDTKTPQGILAVIAMKEYENYSLDNSQIYIYCDNVSDPGNLGTIIRTADAAGINGVILSPDCTDVYSPKSVRSSMGSFFNIDIITKCDYNTLKKYKTNGYKLFCGALERDSVQYDKVDYNDSVIIIVGNEANGVSHEILNLSQHIIIPIYGKAESLNVGVAAAILMYEASKQRRGQLNE